MIRTITRGASDYACAALLIPMSAHIVAMSVIAQQIPAPSPRSPFARNALKGEWSQLMKRHKRKLATLTPAENRDWEWFFSWYLNNGFTEINADRKAWKDMQALYPRLRKFRGCRDLPARKSRKRKT